MSNFMGVGIFWIGLNRADLGCWRLTSKELWDREKVDLLSDTELNFISKCKIGKGQETLNMHQVPTALLSSK